MRTDIPSLLLSGTQSSKILRLCFGAEEGCREKPIKLTCTLLHITYPRHNILCITHDLKIFDSLDVRNNSQRRKRYRVEISIRFDWNVKWFTKVLD